ncbi:hypothetical protein [Roseateles sp.]|uniref:hypothetical protein n=1 Tax=Roseateles sp. TaxID=1971397 RepID=UPI003BAC9695
MKKTAVVLVAVLAASALAAPAELVRPPVGHPLVGKWQWTRGVNSCTEVYEYKDDGTAPVVSGAEKTDNVYTVAPNPDSNGFYRMTIRTTKDYGGKDCGDDTSDSTGMESENFLIFNPDRSQYLACYEPKLEKCFGPLRRVQK